MLIVSQHHRGNTTELTLKNGLNGKFYDTHILLQLKKINTAIYQAPLNCTF